MTSINRNNGVQELKALSGPIRETRLQKSLRPAFELSYFHGWSPGKELPKSNHLPTAHYLQLESSWAVPTCHIK